jgi:hypothetical protein
MGALKSFITYFVQKGIAAVSTPEMKVEIRNAFAAHGCFNEIRSPAMKQILDLD